MTKKSSTLIVVVLDRSGSMSTVRDATIEGFNRFLYEQKQLPGEARMTLIQFDDRYERDFTMQPLEEIHLEYSPRGSTALLYAMGRTIDETGQYLAERNPKNRPDKVVFVTITDGYENYSHAIPGHNYTQKAVFDKITHQREKYKWEFLFLGANQDAIASGAAMGIPASHSMSYDPSKLGTQSVYGTMSQSIGNTRSGFAGGAQITNEQREAYNATTGTDVAQTIPDLSSSPDDPSSSVDSSSSEDFSGGGGGDSGGGGAGSEV